MNADLVPQDMPSDLAETQPSQQNPAAVYVASLVSDHSRRNMWRHLNRIAALGTRPAPARGLRRGR